jgi:phosphoribosylaminoimidazole-succinocarboxamide synthase
MLPVECVARGYLTGGGLKEYEKTGAVSGVDLASAALRKFLSGDVVARSYCL